MGFIDVLRRDDVHNLAWLLSSIGALNWGVLAVSDKGLVQEILGLGASQAEIVYLIIGVAGLVSLYHLARSL
jgi:uncharacterized membrane protein YuzA (DUF378 family)